ncbi:tetratricopeptide repeat protein [Streptomyces paradoxus]|uniref:tetratricopeptide repeat protein n=1 Tax=Streptomyces paradoxus TaxID=66375 RepID=UPI0036FEA9E2
MRRAAALSCALPRWLDGDVFRAAANCPDGEADTVYDWLRSLPFVADRDGERLRYHDVVRAPMLRSERRRSPRAWAARQRGLAQVFGGWREEAEQAVADPWADGTWRDLRLAETYHLLCTGDREAVLSALRDCVRACAVDEVTARHWAQALADAGRDAEAEGAADWGGDLTEALADGGVTAALALLLRRAGFDSGTRALAHTGRGSALRHGGAHEEALAEYDRALALDPGLALAYRSRAMAKGELGDYEGALTDLDEALSLHPEDAQGRAIRGDYLRIEDRYDEALRDLDEAIRLDPGTHIAWASRGAIRFNRGDLEAALADLTQALELKPDYPWALTRRARVWRVLGHPDRQMADLDHSVSLNTGWPWSRCERGDALRIAGRDEEAVADLDVALALDPTYTSAYASRGESLARLGRHADALADLNKAVESRPGYVWALCRRAVLHAVTGRWEEARADVERVRELDSEMLERLPDTDRAVLAPLLAG